MSRNWIIAGVAAVCLITGVAISHVIEPGVRVEKIMLTTNTPALRLFPAKRGSHPIALLLANQYALLPPRGGGDSLGLCRCEIAMGGALSDLSS